MLTDEQDADGHELARMLPALMSTIQARSPQPLLAGELSDADAHRAEVHQASGTTAVQLGIDVPDGPAADQSTRVRDRPDCRSHLSRNPGAPPPTRRRWIETTRSISMNRSTDTEPTSEAQIVRTLLELADTLVADFDIIDSLTVLTARCVEILDTAATGILLADSNGHLRLVAASSEQARLLELSQLQNDQGPCTEAFASGQPVSHTDLPGAIERWPQFAPFAIGAGYSSVYAIPLRLRGDVIGALNLFRSDAGPLASGDIALARAFADLASITVLQAEAATDAERRDGQLQYALDSRIIIEQAKGMLAEYAQIDMAAAFEHIRAHARNTNTKLTLLATNIVDRQLDLDTFTAAPSRQP